MFNSPLLDVTIGLVFVFLLYSLLVTSVQEGLATILALRARMLKKAIVSGMLSNTSDTKLSSILKRSVTSFELAIDNLEYFFNNKPRNNKTIGYLFYEHPIIKNYGANRFFSLPSYISAKNFSTVLIDVLRKNSPESQNSADIIRIKNLIDGYDQQKGPTPEILIEEEPLQILKQFLDESNYDIGVFKLKIENWFEDTMDRVSGWYKRKTQFLLFGLGLLVACVFNVDTIKIANKLSTDKDAREKMVQLAIVAADKYKDDPRVKKTCKECQDERMTKADSDMNREIYEEYQSKIDSVKSLLDGDIKSANQIIATGWGLDTLTKTFSEEIKIDSKNLLDNINNDYNYLINYSDAIRQKELKHNLIDSLLIDGLIRIGISEQGNISKRDSMSNYLKKHAEQFNGLGKVTTEKTRKDSVIKAKQLLKLLNDSACLNLARLISINSETKNKSKDLAITGRRYYTISECIRYIFVNTFKGTTLLGFLITSFAISMGAPFWFDLLNKLVKIRATGKKEDGSGDGTSSPRKQEPVPATVPVTNININPQQQPGEEAVG